MCEPKSGCNRGSLRPDLPAVPGGSLRRRRQATNDSSFRQVKFVFHYMKYTGTFSAALSDGSAVRQQANGTMKSGVAATERSLGNRMRTRRRGVSGHQECTCLTLFMTDHECC